MKNYSAEWKHAQQEKHGGWAQKDEDSYGEITWRWHYIANNIEYAIGNFWTKKDCEKDAREWNPL
jgi:hypothetical protein